MFNTIVNEIYFDAIVEAQGHPIHFLVTFLDLNLWAFDASCYALSTRISEFGAPNQT